MAATKKSLVGTRRSTVAGERKKKSSSSRSSGTKLVKSKVGGKEFFVDATREFLNKDGKHFLTARLKRGGITKFYDTKTSQYIATHGHLSDNDKEAASRLPPPGPETATQKGKREADIDSIKWDRMRTVSDSNLKCNNLLTLTLENRAMVSPQLASGRRFCRGARARCGCRYGGYERCQCR